MATTAGAARRRPRGRRRRTLHLVDVENLVGDPRAATAAAIRATLDAYRRAIRVEPDDLVVLAANPGVALNVGLAWPGALLRTARGPDGADLALLDDLRDLTALGGGPSGERFDRVAIGGGDHIYAPAVRRLTADGTPVVVVSRPESLAFVLRRAASQVIDLDTGGTAAPATVSRSVAFVVCESGPDRWRS